VRERIAAFVLGAVACSLAGGVPGPARTGHAPERPEVRDVAATLIADRTVRPLRVCAVVVAREEVISTRPRSGEPAHVVNVHLEVDGKRVLICLADNGPPPGARNPGDAPDASAPPPRPGPVVRP
jgi:hypothetical protein